jgi:hypothetical protein
MLLSLQFIVRLQTKAIMFSHNHYGITLETKTFKMSSSKETF